MQAGKMDRRIVIQKKTETRDELNQPIETWTDFAEVWAAKEDIKDSERLTAQEVGAEITTRFQIRWSSRLSDLDPEDRLTFDGRVYAIAAVKEIGRREGLEITAAARAERA